MFYSIDYFTQKFIPDVWLFLDWFHKILPKQELWKLLIPAQPKVLLFKEFLIKTLSPDCRNGCSANLCLPFQLLEWRFQHEITEPSQNNKHAVCYKLSAKKKRFCLF